MEVPQEAGPVDEGRLRSIVGDAGFPNAVVVRFGATEERSFLISVPVSKEERPDLENELVALKQQAQPSEILYVADAMTGQDAVRSARAFHEQLEITGVILTKLDGDARGGAILSIREETGSPIRYPRRRMTSAVA